MSAPIVDPATGEVLPPDTSPPPEPENESEVVAALREELAAVREELATTKIDLNNAERALREERREVLKLRAELNEQRQEADEMPQVKLIYRAWVRATGRNPKRTKLGPARQKAVLARLREGRDFDFVLRAATVGALAANPSDREAERLALIAALRKATDLLPEGEAQKVRKVYKSTLPRGFQKYDDLELICRNEVNLERFARLADVIDPEGKMQLLVEDDEPV